MSPDDYRQSSPNQPLSSGRDWQAEAVYGAMHPGYSPADANPRPIPASQPTAPISGDAPHMPGSNTEPSQGAPLPPLDPPSQQPPAAQPYVPPATVQAPPHTKPGPTYPAYSSMKKRRWPAVLIAFVVVGLLAGVGYTGYQTFFADKQTAKNAPASPSPTPSPKSSQNTPAGLASLNGAAINPPSDMAGFTAKNSTAPGVKTYTDASGKCVLQFGTLPATALPGKTIQELVAPQLESLKRGGATVAGPTSVGTLALKDATNQDTSYTVPTVRITFVHGEKQGLSYYSAAILKGGERAFVSRSCVNPTGAIDQAAFDGVETKAKQLTVTKQ